MRSTTRDHGHCLSGLLPIALALGCAVALALVLEPGAPARAGFTPDVAALGSRGIRPGSVLTEPVTGTTSVTICLPLVLRSSLYVTNTWTAVYYADPTLGTPVSVVREKSVDYDWGMSAPSAQLPADYFSASWAGTWHFDAGPYTFFLLADDGVRLWVDGELLLDVWYEGQTRHYVTWSAPGSGFYPVRLEYFDATGPALVRLRWHRKDLYPRWTGEYYDDALMGGSEVYSRTVDGIQFDWQNDCPSGLACNDFAISWSASPFFEKGMTRLSVYADDGYQLLIDGVPQGGEGWHEGQGDVFYDFESIELEQHSIVFNMHDQSGTAEARLLRTFLGQPKFTAEYFANVDLLGVPDVTRTEDVIFYDWGEGKPRPTMSVSDYFSVRWTGSRYFRSGFYRFGVFADDGTRLWVDGELLLNVWRSQSGLNYAQARFLQTGLHDIVLEYFDNTGRAEIRFWWE